MPARAVFLDKDGTLIEDVPYNVDPEQVKLAPGAADGLAALAATDYQLIVVSNQSGVAHGYFAEDKLAGVEQRLQDFLGERGVKLNGFYYCPHHESGRVARYAIRCACRKPQPGLILRAAQEHDIDLPRSWLIGDILNDIEAGHAAGCRTILIDNGNETEWQLSLQRRPDFLVRDLQEAAELILRSEEPEG
jgi:D-glycero-D-manno-heptose 1,7-bisphosphate phosphatase